MKWQLNIRNLSALLLIYTYSLYVLMQNILSRHTCLYKITSTVIRTSDFFFIILYTQQPILKILFALSLKAAKLKPYFLHTQERKHTHLPRPSKRQIPNQQQSHDDNILWRTLSSKTYYSLMQCCYQWYVACLEDSS